MPSTDLLTKDALKFVSQAVRFSIVPVRSSPSIQRAIGARNSFELDGVAPLAGGDLVARGDGTFGCTLDDRAAQEQHRHHDEQADHQHRDRRGEIRVAESRLEEAMRRHEQNRQRKRPDEGGQERQQKPKAD